MLWAQRFIKIWQYMNLFVCLDILDKRVYNELNILQKAMKEKQLMIVFAESCRMV